MIFLSLNLKKKLEIEQFRHSLFAVMFINSKIDNNILLGASKIVEILFLAFYFSKLLLLDFKLVKCYITKKKLLATF